METNKADSNFYIGDTSYLTMKTSTIIEMRDHLRLMIGDDRGISLDVSIKADFDKIKCLEIILKPGKILYIPAYWWYTFKFDENTSVSCFKYRTYMNNIAISPKICMYALQNQNVERKIAKKIDIKHLQENNNNKIIDTNSNREIMEINKDLMINNNNNNILPASEINNETLIDNNIPDILIPKESETPLYL